MSSPCPKDQHVGPFLALEATVVLAAREFTMNVARVGASVGCGGVTPDERWLAAVWPFVCAWLPAPPAAVLEIGCGPLGGFVPMLRSAGFHATGVDPAAPEGPWYHRAEFERNEIPQPAQAIVAC